MSDNEDERLDRAKRIRKMREGNDRQDDTDEVSDEPTETSDGEATGEQKEAVVTNADSGTGTEKSGDGDRGDEDEAGGAETANDEDGSMELERDGDSQSDKEDLTESGDVDVPSPEVNVPETTGTEPVESEATSLEAEENVRAPLPDSEELEEALETSREGDSDGVAEGKTATPADVLDDGSGTEEETRVLEFRLGDEYYCLDIDYIEEIVKEETITRVPNTPTYVEGVVDLRGQITTIINPKVTIEKDDVTPGGLIVVFDSDSFEDQGHIGWVVDDVRQVSPITDNEVNEPPVEEEYINGVIDRDDDEQFVIWTDPDMAMEEAE